jgi:hypothetical protein
LETEHPTHKSLQEDPSYPNPNRMVLCKQQREFSLSACALTIQRVILSLGLVN